MSSYIAVFTSHGPADTCEERTRVLVDPVPCLDVGQQLEGGPEPGEVGLLAVGVVCTNKSQEGSTGMSERTAGPGVQSGLAYQQLVRDRRTCDEARAPLLVLLQDVSHVHRVHDVRDRVPAEHLLRAGQIQAAFAGLVSAVQQTVAPTALCDTETTHGPLN